MVLPASKDHSSNQILFRNEHVGIITQNRLSGKAKQATRSDHLKKLWYILSSLFFRSSVAAHALVANHNAGLWSMLGLITWRPLTLWCSILHPTSSHSPLAMPTETHRNAKTPISIHLLRSLPAHLHLTVLGRQPLNDSSACSARPASTQSALVASRSPSL